MWSWSNGIQQWLPGNRSPAVVYRIKKYLIASFTHKHLTTEIKPILIGKNKYSVDYIVSLPVTNRASIRRRNVIFMRSPQPDVINISCLFTTSEESNQRAHSNERCVRIDYDVENVRFTIPDANYSFENLVKFGIRRNKNSLWKLKESRCLQIFFSRMMRCFAAYSIPPVGWNVTGALSCPNSKFKLTVSWSGERVK